MRTLSNFNLPNQSQRSNISFQEEGKSSQESPFSFILAVLVIAIGIFVLFNSFLGPKKLPTQVSQNPLKETVEKSLEGSIGTYAVAIADLKGKEKFNLNEHKTFAAGSLYKLWVMVAVFEKIQAGQLKEDQLLSENIADLNAEFNINPNLAEQTEGEITLTVKDALNQMIVISHNYAALLLTKQIKLSSVEAFLKEKGFADSKVGYDGEDPLTSAADTAFFFEKLYKGELGNEENTNKMFSLLKKQQLNDKLPKYLPAKDATAAHKTGEIGPFSHDGGIIFTSFGDYILVVLSESSSPAGANERIAQISKAVFEYFKEKNT